MRRTSKINLYKKMRNSLLATTKRTDNRIITECNIIGPSLKEQGTSFSKTSKTKNNNLVLSKKRKSGRNNKYNMTIK